MAQRPEDTPAYKQLKDGAIPKIALHPEYTDDLGGNLLTAVHKIYQALQQNSQTLSPNDQELIELVVRSSPDSLTDDQKASLKRIVEDHNEIRTQNLQTIDAARNLVIKKAKRFPRVKARGFTRRHFLGLGSSVAITVGAAKLTGFGVSMMNQSSAVKIEIDSYIDKVLPKVPAKDVLTEEDLRKQRLVGELRVNMKERLRLEADYASTDAGGLVITLIAGVATLFSGFRTLLIARDIVDEVTKPPYKIIPAEHKIITAQQPGRILPPTDFDPVTMKDRLAQKDSHY